MPFTVSEEDKEHLASGRTCLGLALRIARRDGQVFGLVDAREDVTLPEFTVGSQTVPETDYRGGILLPLTDLVQSEDISKADTIEFNCILGDYITAEDVNKNLFLGARFSLTIYRWDESRIIMLRQRGRVGQTTLNGPEAKFQMKGLADAFRVEVLGVTSAVSRANWDDPELAFFDLDGDTDDGHPARVTDAVSAVGTDARRTFTVPDTVGQPARRFVNGTVEWGSGSNAGALPGEIMDWNAGTGQVTLWQPAPYPVEVGDTVTLQIAPPRRIEEWIEYFGDATLFCGFDGIVTAEGASEVQGD